MRLDEFAKWLPYRPTRSGEIIKPSYVKFYTDTIRNIEKAEDTDMDEEFCSDGMAWIERLYSYSEKDRENDRPNLTKIKLTRPTLYGTLADHKEVLEHYRIFCEQNPPK